MPPPASDLGWARQEPVRTIRFLIQRGLLLPFTEAMAHPKVEGREWVRDLERPVIFAANHSSHADTSLILHALGDHARDRTVVAAAADYWFKRPLLGNIVSLFLNTFPFSRTGGAQAQLHSSSQLLKSGWNLVLFPEGSRSPDGRIQEFKAGRRPSRERDGDAGRAAAHPRRAPDHAEGPEAAATRPGARAHRQADGARARTKVRRQFTARVEKAVRTLALEPEQPEIQGSWIERWRLMKPRELRYEDSPEPAPALEAKAPPVKAPPKVRRGHCRSGRCRLHPKNRMVGRDPPQVRLGRVGRNAPEKDADLGLPALEVSLQDRDLLVVADLDRAKRLDLAAQEQLAGTRHPDVADPLGLAPRRHQVLRALVGQEVDRRGSPFA